MSSSSYKRIAALATSDRILGHIAQQKEPVSGIAAAKDLGLPQATVMSHLATLADLGYVRQVGRESYALGMKLAIYWARTKAHLEAEQAAIGDNLREIGA